MGPQRISQVARWLGKTTAQLQHISRQFMRQLNAELAEADADGDLKGAMDEIQSLRRQMDDLRQEIKSSALRPVEEGKTAVRETKEALHPSFSTQKPAPKNENTIAPRPKLPNLIDVPDDPE
jgi:Sec-independent protein translocase protein TatA